MRYLIIDATNLLYRTWHVTREADKKVLIFSYLRSIKSYVNRFEPDVCYCVSDKRLIRGQKNFRRQNEDYKQNRDKSVWNQVHEAEETLEQLGTHLGIINMFPGILEADDVIAYLCRTLGGIKTVVSTDNDMAQLVSNSVHVYSPIKKILITPENFQEHYPVSLQNYITYKSIIGDVSDNIKGLPGYGKVKAKKLTESFQEEFPKLSGDLQQLQKNNMNMVDLAQGLVFHPEEKQIYDEQLNQKPVSNFKQFISMCRELQLYGIVHDADAWHAVFKLDLNSLPSIIGV
jgi:DNA polymerase-1